MPRALGSDTNLEECVDTHLFVIGPNNSGTTFVRRAIDACQEVWSLPREGQHMLGFSGPDVGQRGLALIWASDDTMLDQLRDSTLYDWKKTRKAWYFQSRAQKHDASVFTTKSPPFLALVQQLRCAFQKPRFLFMVRNPYAVIEAICRYRERQFPSRDKGLDIASSHILKCLQIQQENIEKHDDIGLFFRYEDMCAQPRELAEKIAQLVPAISDIDLDRAYEVKGRYHEKLRDMNADQIGCLSASDINRINQHLVTQEALLERFGYSLL